MVEDTGVEVQGFLLDVEGTLVADKRYRAIDGAVEFIRRVRLAGLPLKLITNNTVDSKDTLVRKLTRAGFDFTIGEVHTCIGAAITHLRTFGAQKCLILGAETLQRMFSDEGFTVVNESEVDAVVVGLDTGLTYERLKLACDAVGRKGAPLIALHRNRLLVDEEGRCAPSVGAIVEAVVYATRVEPVLIGKPSPTYFQQALDDIALPPQSVMVVSDDPLSDLAGARRMGMQAAFVLSGKYPEQSVIDSLPVSEKPEVIVDSVAGLLEQTLLDTGSKGTRTQT
jgi:HAD superfamily hydrolase (TIGR01458 family)